MKLIGGADLIVIRPKVRKRPAHGNQSIELRVPRNLFPEQELHFPAESQSGLSCKRRPQRKCPELGIRIFRFGICIFCQMQSQFCGSFIDLGSILLCKAKADKTVNVTVLHPEPVAQLDVRIIKRIVIQADVNFLQVEILRHIVGRRRVKYRNIANTVEAVQIIGIHIADTHRFFCQLIAVCIHYILMMLKIISCRRCEICCVACRF